MPPVHLKMPATLGRKEVQRLTQRYIDKFGCVDYVGEITDTYNELVAGRGKKYLTRLELGDYLRVVLRFVCDELKQKLEQIQFELQASAQEEAAKAKEAAKQVQVTQQGNVNVSVGANDDFRAA